MPDIKWIKLDTGIFDDEKIKIILSMPEGKSLLVIWLKLLCLAGRINNSGVLMVNKTIPYTVEMLGAVFGEQEQIMRLAVDTFERLGMVEEYNGALLIPNWEKHQNGYKLELIREQTRARVEQYRERQRNSVTQNSVTSALHERYVTLQNKNQELRGDPYLDSCAISELGHPVLVCADDYTGLVHEHLNDPVPSLLC